MISQLTWFGYVVILLGIWHYPHGYIVRYIHGTDVIRYTQ
jgi:hypothetical protein